MRGFAVFAPDHRSLEPPNFAGGHPFDAFGIGAGGVGGLEAFADDRDVLEVVPERGRVRRAAAIRDHRGKAQPRRQNDVAPHVRRKGTVQDAALGEQADVFKEIRHGSRLFVLRGQRYRDEVRADGGIGVERRELPIHVRDRRTKLFRLERFANLVERGYLIGAAHMAQLDQRGDRRRRDDQQRQERGESAQPFGSHARGVPATGAPHLARPGRTSRQNRGTMNRKAELSLRFVLIMGVVNLFADMTYEGARGEVGPFLGHFGASGAIVGVVVGGSELAGYGIRYFSGKVADRTGRYWIDAWAGYALNLLCVPALAFAGGWGAAAALVIGERLGRGVRKPVISAVLARAGAEIGGGRAFGINQLLDQIGATAGPLIVAYAVARGGFSHGFAVLIVPAILAFLFLALATDAGKTLTPDNHAAESPSLRDRQSFRRYAAGGAFLAAGYVDFALIAFRFQRDHVVGTAAISIWFAVAMAVGALAAPILGRLYDRYGNGIVAAGIVAGTLASPLAFLGTGATAEAGAALWGLGMAVQDALLLALIASVIAKRRGATTFGLYDLIFGIAWFAGSTLCGVLLDRSVIALVSFSVAAQLAAVPFFLYRPRTAA